MVGASENGHFDIVKLLLEHGAKEHLEWALLEASVSGHTDIVKLLFEHGAELDEDDWFEVPVLVEVSKNGHIEIVKLLLEHGAKNIWGGL